MKALFLPAEALMDRFSYRVKFALIGVVMVLAFAVLMTYLGRELDATIEQSRGELIASGLARPLSKLVELTQQHRGMSSAVLSGAQDMAARRTQREADVEAAFAALEAALPAAEHGGEAWRGLRERWEELRGEGMSLVQTENFRLHTELVAGLLELQIALADRYGLSFDPAPQTHYMAEAAVDHLPQLLEQLGQLRAKGARALARGLTDEPSRVEIVVLSNETQKAMRQLEQNLAKVLRHRPELQPRLEPSLGVLRERLAEVDKVVQEVIYQSGTASIGVTAYFDLATRAIEAGYAQMHEILLPTLDELLRARIDEAENVLRLSIGVLLAMLAAAAYLATGAYLSVMGSVHGLREGSRRLAAGDLTVRIDLRARDELRRVAGSFNDMTAAMRSLIAGIQHSARELAQASERMLASSREIETASVRQSESASSMAAAVEQMTVGVEHIATNAGRASELARESGALSRQGGETVDAVVAEIRDIAASVAGSARSVKALGESSEQISTVVGVIREIAEQTNLLALNAAIEAARAGEQGRGFAVVADEVRKLAERTAVSTREIGAMVERIQQGTQAAVQDMEQGVARVDAGVERARHAGTAMAQIRAGTERVQQTVAEISGALREQSAASSDIARNVETIAQMAEENSAAAGGNLETAGGLERLAHDLQAQVGRFRVG